MTKEQPMPTEMIPAHKVREMIAAAVAFVALVIFSNLGSLRILTLAGLAVDGGTLLYPVTFTARDLLHKKIGARLVRFVIILTAVINLALFAFVWLIAKLPPDLEVGLQLEYGLVLIPGFRLVVGSIIAMAMADFVDTFAYSIIQRKYGKRHQWLRVIFSGCLSIPVDTTIFLAIAFAGWIPLAVMGEMFIANITVKFAVMLLSFGSIYLVKDDRE
ncbi:MAG: queuosine precursor transporter [Clostridiales bacterium]|nr:queuosine precursor transporter [Clostridiales bacterium]